MLRFRVLHCVMAGLAESGARRGASPKPAWSASLDAPVNHVAVIDGAVAFLCGDCSSLIQARQLFRHTFDHRLNWSSGLHESAGWHE